MSDALRNELSAALQNPNVQRYLSMLRAAEGTDKHPDPYRVAGGGRSMLPDLNEYRRVPWEFTQTDGKKNTSTAAGAYQFLQSTWQDVAANLGVRDFSPQSQDLGALYLMKRNGSLADVMDGRFKDAIAKDGSTWASLPTSPHPQKKRSMDWTLGHLGGSAPKTTAHRMFPAADGTVAMPENQRERDKLTQIADSSFGDEAKRRMTSLMGMMPKATATDKPLVGDPYPDLFDRELRDLIDTV